MAGWAHSRRARAERLGGRRPLGGPELERRGSRTRVASGQIEEARGQLQTSGPAGFGGPEDASVLLRDAGDAAGAVDLAREATASNPSAWVSVGDAALADRRPVDAVRAHAQVPRAAGGAAAPPARVGPALGRLGLPAPAAALR